MLSSMQPEPAIVLLKMGRISLYFEIVKDKPQGMCLKSKDFLWSSHLWSHSVAGWHLAECRLVSEGIADVASDCVPAVLRRNRRPETSPLPSTLIYKSTNTDSTKTQTFQRRRRAECHTVSTRGHQFVAFAAARTRTQSDWSAGLLAQVRGESVGQRRRRRCNRFLFVLPFKCGEEQQIGVTLTLTHLRVGVQPIAAVKPGRASQWKVDVHERHIAREQKSSRVWAQCHIAARCITARTLALCLPSTSSLPPSLPPVLIYALSPSFPPQTLCWQSQGCSLVNCGVIYPSL